MLLIKLTPLILIFCFLVQYPISNQSRKPSSTIRTLDEYNYKRSYLSLSNTINDISHIHRPGEDSSYVQKLTGKVIQTAHRVAADEIYDPSNDLYEEYNSFLVLALTIPHHESSLMHITKRDGNKYCYFSNDLAAMKDKVTAVDQYVYMARDLEQELDNSSDKSAQKLLRKQIKTLVTQANNAQYLVKGMEEFKSASGHLYGEFFKPCSYFENISEVNQLLFSNDYSDVGLMMFNSKSHRDFFFDQKIYNIDDVLNYALEFVFEKGFLSVALNSQNYSCIKKHNYGTLAYREALVRGSWAGKYNSGNTSKTCRFEDTSSRHINKDKGFYNSLGKILEKDSNDLSLYYKYLPQDSIEYKALKEIINNFKHNSNNREYIDQVLQADYSNHDIIYDPALEDIAIEEKKTVDLELEVKELDLEQEMSSIEPITEVEANTEAAEIFPKVHTDYKYIISGTNVNLRNETSLKRSSLCANTKLLNNTQVTIEIIYSEGDFHFVKSNEFLNLEIYSNCANDKSFYIHKDYVKKIEDQKVVNWIKLYDWSIAYKSTAMGLTDIATNIAAGEYAILDEKVTDDQHHLVKIRLPSNEQYWINIGMDHNEKAEFLNE